MTTSAVFMDELIDEVGFYSLAGVGEVSRDEWYAETGLRSTPDSTVVLEVADAPAGPGFDQTKGSHHRRSPGSWMPLCPRAVGGRLPTLDEQEGNPE